MSLGRGIGENRLTWGDACGGVPVEFVELHVLVRVAVLQELDDDVVELVRALANCHSKDATRSV
jgi:hypothetical protein